MTDTLLAEQSLQSFVRSTILQTGRLLRRWTREPGIVIQSVVFPAFLLLVFDTVLGRTVTAMSGMDSVATQVPLVALVGAIFGSLATGIAMVGERADGLLARFWVLPIHRVSGIAARLLAEAVRVAISTTILTVVGVLIGLRFEYGVASIVGFVLVPVCFTVGFATMVAAVATRAGGKTVLELSAIVCLLLLFFNSGYAPVDQYPGWLQPIVAAQPMTPATNTMRALVSDGPVLVPALQTTAWIIAMVGVFGWLAVRGYSRAARE